MKPRTKCALYVAIAALMPVAEAATIVAKNGAWPTVFEASALAVQSLLQALLAVKMYYSDPNESEKKI